MKKSLIRAELLLPFLVAVLVVGVFFCPAGVILATPTSTPTPWGPTMDPCNSEVENIDFAKGQLIVVNTTTLITFNQGDLVIRPDRAGSFIAGKEGQLVVWPDWCEEWVEKTVAEIATFEGVRVILTLDEVKKNLLQEVH